MPQVSVTTFRRHIPDYLAKVRQGEDISLTSRGKVIACLVPPVDQHTKAREELAVLRKNCHIGDIISPVDTPWEVDCAVA